MGLARAKLGGQPRRVADADDVVVSAFASFCRGAELGRFQRLEDRDDLWQVLGMILRWRTARRTDRVPERCPARTTASLLGHSAKQRRPTYHC
jgi:hypothetical protein